MYVARSEDISVLYMYEVRAPSSASALRRLPACRLLVYTHCCLVSTALSICVSVQHTTAHSGRGISERVRLGRRVFGSIFNPTYASRRAGLPVVTEYVCKP